MPTIRTKIRQLPFFGLLALLTLLEISGCSKNIPVNHSATSSDTDGMKSNIVLQYNSANEEVFAEYDTPPTFPGSPLALRDYIYDNLAYPQDAFDNKIEGRVVLRFRVDKTGKVDSVSVIKSLEPTLDAEALRVLKSLPNFQPAMIIDPTDNQWIPIDQWMSIPITFKISDYLERKKK